MTDNTPPEMTDEDHWESIETVVQAIRGKDQAIVNGDDPRVIEWIQRREAALWHLRYATATARRNLGSGNEDWQDVFDILSGLASNYRLDLLNVCQRREVHHLPGDWVEADFTQSERYEAAQLRAAGGVSYGDED